MASQATIVDSSENRLLSEFRTRYHQYTNAVQEALTSSALDSNVLARLGDDLDEFGRIVTQHSGVFPPEELQILITSLSAMRLDIRLQYQHALDQSHHGRPAILTTIHTGGRGRPRYHIDPDWLHWAYGHRSVAGIAHYLGIGRWSVRSALLEYGIVEPQSNPFATDTSDQQSTNVEDNSDINEAGTDPRDDLLDPHFPDPLPEFLEDIAPHQGLTSYTGPLSLIDNDELDGLLSSLHQHFRRAGVTMLHGMLRRLGHQVPRERIRQSLLRIDPVQRVFDRIRIRRREYSVPGPNALWHHDGQHGLIRWRIVIHGFIDGYSRLITGLRASNNNQAATVLDVFINAALMYGVPLQLRGDHGTENLRVAEFMNVAHGEGRGSYIWGRSIHNVRIERLWVDVTAQVGAKWHEFFTILEIRHGLDVNNMNHIWLLHCLYLSDLNTELAFFAEGWNQHRMQLRNGPNRSPADMFGFDMLVHGVRGDQLPTDLLDDEELEVFGVDWEGLQDEALLASHHGNNSHTEGSSSWIGHIGPPDNLNEVEVEPPIGPLGREESEDLDRIIEQWIGRADDDSLISRWLSALAFLQIGHSHIF